MRVRHDQHPPSKDHTNPQTSGSQANQPQPATTTPINCGKPLDCLGFQDLLCRWCYLRCDSRDGEFVIDGEDEAADAVIVGKLGEVLCPGAYGSG